jgi:IclR family transcriptional regulator, KDG regulon repressor
MSRTIERGLAVLEAVAQSPMPVGIQSVAQKTGLDKATSLRMLHSLCSTGYLVKIAGTKTYAVTDKLQRLAMGTLGDQELRDLAHPHLTELRDRLSETAHLGVMRNHRIIYVDKVESPRSIRLVSNIGQEMPLHCTALGKVILAELPKSECQSILQQIELTRRTNNTITEQGDLLKELTNTRRRGWALDNEENEENATCVAVVITDSKGSTIGSISVSGPSFRMAPRTKEIAAAIQKTAKTISRKLRKISSAGKNN